MEEVISGWHYDRILTQRKGELQVAWAEEARIKRIMREELERFAYVQRTKTWEAHNLTEESVQRNLALHRSTQKKDYTWGATKEYEKTQKAHPILIGPATLDSLLESEPDRLDYIQEGKFPFDDVFFECMDPPAHVLPGYNLPARLCGVQLNKAVVVDPDGEKKYDCYTISTHFNLQDGSYAEVFAPVMQKEQWILQANVRLPRNKESIILSRHIERMEGSEDHVRMGSFSDCQRVKDMPPHTPFYFGDEKHVFDFPLEVNIQETANYIDRFNRLAINLINFVNAQNVTLIPHTRKVKTRMIRPDGRQITHEANAPYHIVGIDTRTVHVEEERTPIGALPWRVYVRGHNRNYRDEQGTIRLVTWVTPHVRGPEDAPWRHHRYAALADMLQREKDKIGEYVPNPLPRSE